MEFILDEKRARRVADALVSSKAYLIDLNLSPEEYFVWKSGVHAPMYCNCRKALGSAYESRLIVDSLVELVLESDTPFTTIAGVSTAGIPWASRVAERLNKPFAYIRSEKKEHGCGLLVEGSRNGSCIVIDDLVAGGGSIVKAAQQYSQETGEEVTGLFSIINWGFSSMKENLSNYNYFALSSYPHIIAANNLNKQEESLLHEFYKNPKEFDYRRFQTNGCATSTF